MRDSERVESNSWLLPCFLFCGHPTDSANSERERERARGRCAGWVMREEDISYFFAVRLRGGFPVLPNDRPHHDHLAPARAAAPRHGTPVDCGAAVGASPSAGPGAGGALAFVARAGAGGQPLAGEPQEDG